ncbi:hypothetical protein Tco_0464624 [Tanacetum coccineum]
MEPTPTKPYQRIMLATSEDLLRVEYSIDGGRYVTAYRKQGLAAETEVTEPKLSAVLKNFVSKYRRMNFESKD